MFFCFRNNVTIVVFVSSELAKFDSCNTKGLLGAAAFCSQDFKIASRSPQAGDKPSSYSTAHTKPTTNVPTSKFAPLAKSR